MPLDPRLAAVILAAVIIALGLLLNRASLDTNLALTIALLACAGLIVAIALQYYRALQTGYSLRRRVQELSTLNQVGEAISASLVMEDLLFSIFTQVSQLTDVSVFYIAFFDAESRTLEYPLVMDKGKGTQILWPGYPGGTAEYVSRNNKLLHIQTNDVQELDRLGIRLSDLGKRYAYFLGIPLTVGKTNLGVMGLFSNSDWAEESVIPVLQTVARQAGLAIHNARLYTQSTELAQRLALINRATQAVMFTLDKEAAIKVACETAMSIGQAQGAAVFLLNKREVVALLAYSIGLSDTQKELCRTVIFQPELYAGGVRLVTNTHAPDKATTTTVSAYVGNYRSLAEILLRSGNTTVGFLTLFYAEPHRQSPSEANLLEMLANQVAAVIDNADLFEVLESYAFEMLQLAHLSRISTSSMELETVIDDIAGILCQMLTMERVTIGLLDGDAETVELVTARADKGQTVRQVLPFRDLPELYEWSRQPSPVAKVFTSSETLFSPAMSKLLGDSQQANILAIAMIANDRVQGLILLGADRRRDLDEREMQLVEMATNQVTTHVQNVRLFRTTGQALKERLEQLSFIEDIAQQITSSLDFNKVISNMLDAAVRATQADMATLALLTEGDKFWLIIQNYTHGEAQRYYRLRGRDEGVIGQVVRSGDTIIVPDNNASPDYVTMFETRPYQSSLVVPLVKQDTVIGALNVESMHPNFFSEAQAGFLKNLAGHAVISIENARLVEEHEYQIRILTSLRDLAFDLSGTLDTLPVTQAILKTALTMFDGQEAALFRYDDQIDHATLLLGKRSDGREFHLGESEITIKSVYQAAQRGDIQAGHDSVGDGELTSDSVTSITVPIMRKGRIQEVLAVAFDEARPFTERDQGTMTVLVSQVVGHLETALLYEQIRSVNNRLRAILNSTRDGVILLDRGGELIEANPAAERLLGVHLDDYIGQHFASALLAQGEANQSGRAGYTTEDITTLARQLRLEPEGITRRRFERQTPSQIIYMEEIGSPVRDSHNQMVGRLLVLRDVSEEARLDEYREEITHMIVHDLRGPLASIISALTLTIDIISGDVHSDTTLSQTLPISLDSANSLMSLVDSLLDLGSDSKLPIHVATVPLREAVDNAFKALSTSFQEAKIRVIVDIPESLPLVQADPNIIRRVLINLLDNALRYTPFESDILVSAAAYQDNALVLVRVADSGPGIPPEERERVFDKFRQVKANIPQRGSKGSGLGLAFCKRGIEAHGQRIWVEDTSPLKGACFAFTLPAAPKGAPPL